ncbi:DEDD exonuclease domain-containing protein [Vallicoccus soli]|uniref:DEDD exnuclease domain-containing protein n=1 Tax=Vallicoccus soli TaxID=2339232 RepID=A0A3A3ZL95_9ACTN|nr:DEDD exonuclease domain-containing protein [Vallicoccus soli]RJK96892.1 DEDD exnuclease domain-containing protein [Vallicoccus soli]
MQVAPRPPQQRRPAPAAAPVAAPVAVQATFDELGTPLREATFVVVDLETTGGSPASCAITEVGAVKVRGGEVLGEFQALVDPGTPIPPFIAVLTGITDAMVAGAERIEAVLPAFLEFLGADAVLVAHNAPFDVGFLQAACAATGRPWPGPRVLDTARIARQLVSRDEAPNCKLGTLARVFRARTTPDHRALSDARATVDVLHGMLERLGGLGVHSLEELATYTSRVSPAQRRKRHLAEGLPHAPGVYVFRDAQDRVLYVGTSKDLRTRVRSYFTASETRSRMAEMVGLAESVTPVVCATALEAQVRELRLIAEHAPRYNRRSRRPDKVTWLKLTPEAFPRLSLVRDVRDDGGAYLGPFSSSRSATAAMSALHEAVPLRQCTQRLSASGRGSACVLAEIGRCGAPCEGRQSRESYAVHASTVRAAFTGDARPVVGALSARIAALAAGERFEEAAAQRDRLTALVRAAARMQRLAGLTRCPEVVAARPTPELGWELALVRWGRLCGSAVVERGVDPWPAVRALVAAGEVVEPVLPGLTPTPAATAEETECVLRWVEQPGTRLVQVEGEWTSPAFGAGAHRALLDAADEARGAAAPFEDRRHLPMASRPVAAGSRLAV